MLLGLYTSAAGMLGQLDRQDAIANNLANINTPGYKRSVVGFSGFSLRFQNALQTTGAAPVSSIIPIPTLYQNRGAGGIQDTGSPTNFALEGPGYFVAQTDKGEKLVRGGNFTLDGTGQLVTSDGYPVLSDRGPIRITSANWSVDADGGVTVDGAMIGKLRIQKDSADASRPTRVISGSLETSNVNTVEEMVSMIMALRSYEACQKTIQNLDQSLDKLINLMGKSG